MNKRRFTRSALACAALLLAAITSQAQPLSNKPIRIVVPFGAGGVADVTSRVVAQKLASQLGQPVIIDNKPSAGGIVAADTVAKSAPDGHTLFLMSNGSAVTVGLFNQLPFDMVKDFTPISTLGYFDIGVLTASDSRFKNLGELVAWAKANPGKLNIGSIAIGSTQHLAAELFKTTAGIDAQIVPFNGTPAVVTALRGRQIDAAVEILTPIMGQINSKAVNLLAITGDKRSALLPGGTLATPAVALVVDTLRSGAASEQVGPGSLNLLTGDLTVSGSDVDIPSFETSLTLSRTFSSRNPAASSTGAGERLELAQGHVGMVVGGRARAALWEPLAAWLSRAAAKC